MTESERQNLRQSCEYNHDPSICKCDRELYHKGQDESVYKSHAHPKKSWNVHGAQKTFCKGDGAGVMISAVCDERRGFGFPLTNEEIAWINKHSIHKDKKQFKAGSIMHPMGSPVLS